MMVSWLDPTSYGWLEVTAGLGISAPTTILISMCSSYSINFVNTNQPIGANGISTIRCVRLLRSIAVGDELDKCTGLALVSRLERRIFVRWLAAPDKNDD
jgi:hypothetical protein